MSDEGAAKEHPGTGGAAPGPAVLETTLTLELRRGLGAQELDRRIRLANRAGDVGARVLAFYLVDLAQRGVHQELGYASVARYAEMRLHMPAPTTREYLLVGRALEELPVIDAAFCRGLLLWSAVRQVVRVATPQTEEDWVEFARGRTAREIAAEVRRRRKGERPTNPARRRIHTTKFRIEASVDAVGWQIWNNARAKMEAECGRPVDDAELMLEAARLLLATRADGSVPGRQPVNDGHFRVLLRHDGKSGQTAVETHEGPVELDLETGSALLREAGRPELGDENSGPEIPPQERDVPTPPALRARVLAREKAPGEIFRCGETSAGGAGQGQKVMHVQRVPRPRNPMASPGS